MTRIWSINGRFALQPLTGVQRYAHEIVRGLDALISEGHPLAVDTDVEILLPPGARRLDGLRAIEQKRVGRGEGHVWEQLWLPVHARGGLLSLCNTGPLAVAKQLVCIHDLNTRNCPESYSRAFRWTYRVLLPALGRRARVLTTVSHFSAGQLSAYGVAPADKIAVVPNGHEHALRWVPPVPTSGEASARDTVVLLGSAAPHKNARLILDLAPQLARLGLSIAVVGASDPRVFAGLGPVPDAANIRWLGRLDDAALAALLQRSLCLAFPSRTEGFGLPPLEAMALGCPVVVSNRASLPEICRDAALYASPDDGDAWLGALRRLRMDSDLRAKLIAAGAARARQFSWRRSAEAYLEIMAKIDGVVLKASQASVTRLRHARAPVGAAARHNEGPDAAAVG
jgi:glycosyltransferase involved in cell wall biosynthesis